MATALEHVGPVVEIHIGKVCISAVSKVNAQDKGLHLRIGMKYVNIETLRRDECISD